MSDNQHAFPLMTTNLSSSLAGKTLFSITGREEGDDDDTTHQFWADNLEQATTMFQRQVLSDGGNDDAAIDEILAATTDAHPWGFITGTGVIAKVNAEGTSVEFEKEILG